MSELWSLVVVLLSVFVLGGAGGQSASGREGGPVSFGVVFCGEGGESASGGCEGGMI